jgi:hypothetical protein
MTAAPAVVATTTPQSQHGGAQGRHLLRVTLRHPSVGSRFSLKQPPGAPSVGTTSAQGFLSRWSWSRQLWLGKDVCRLLPRLAQALLGAAADRHRPPPQGAGALCQHQGGAGERPPISTLRARPKEHPSIRCARGVELASAHYEQPSSWLPTAVATAGPLPFKANEVVLM